VRLYQTPFVGESLVNTSRTPSHHFSQYQKNVFILQRWGFSRKKWRNYGTWANVTQFHNPGTAQVRQNQPLMDARILRTAPRLAVTGTATHFPTHLPAPRRRNDCGHALAAGAGFSPGCRGSGAVGPRYTITPVGHLFIAVSLCSFSSYLL